MQRDAALHGYVLGYPKRYLLGRSLHVAMLIKPNITDVRSTKLKQWGSSRAVRIPKSVCETAGVDVGTEFLMESGSDQDGPFVLLRPAKSDHRNYADAPYVDMGELFGGYEGDYAATEADWGPDIGAEVVE